MAFLLAATWLIYHQTLSFGFLPLDDPQLVTENPDTRAGLGLTSLEAAWTKPVLNLWHPLTMISHQADVSLGGLNTQVHRVHSLVLHLVCGILLWLCLGHLRCPAVIRLGVTGLFLLHPQRVEVVAWVAERKELLSSLLGLTSLYCWLRHLASPPERSRLWFFATSLALVSGLLAKPSLVVWPALLLLAAYGVSLQNDPKASVRDFLRSQTLRMGLFLFLPALVVAAITLFLQGARSDSEIFSSLTLDRRFSSSFLKLGYYLQRFVWPSDLAFYYPWPTKLPLKPLAIGLLPLVGLCLCWMFRRRWPMGLLGLGWFLLVLAPTSGLFPSGDSIAPDRYTYLASPGLLLLVIGTGWYLLKKCLKPKAAYWVTALLLMSCLGVVGLKSHRYATTWKDLESMTRNAIAEDNSNNQAHYLLGRLLEEKGQWDEAIHHLKRTVEVRPDHRFAPDALDRLEIRQESLDQWLLTPATETEKPTADHLAMWGQMLAQQGRKTEAMRTLQELLQRPGYQIHALYQLGELFRQSGKESDARSCYQKILEHRPDESRARAALTEMEN